MRLSLASTLSNLTVMSNYEDDFFGGANVSAAVAKNAVHEAKIAAKREDYLKAEINFHLRRMGIITASKFDTIGIKEVKASSSANKETLIDWACKNGGQEELQKIASEKFTVKNLNDADIAEILSGITIQSKAKTKGAILSALIKEGHEKLVNDKVAELKPHAPLELLTKAEIEKIIDTLEGELVLTAGALTYMDRLLWECDLNLEYFINQTMKTGFVPDWISAKSKSMSYGTKFEPIAAAAYTEYTGVKAAPMSTIFMDDDEMIAATSDLFGVCEKTVTLEDSFELVIDESGEEKLIPIVIEAGRKIAVEIKNPFAGENHYKNFRSKQIDSRYYSQCVGNMVCQGADEVHFFSYDERVKKNKKVLIRVKREDIAEEVADLEFRLNFFKSIYKQRLKELDLFIPKISF